MRDTLTKEQRSALMSRMRGTNTAAERIIFELLRRRRLSFTTHSIGLPGRPDVAFESRRLAVFIDGDFFHGRGFQTWKHKLSLFWLEKISGNIRRDRRVDRRLWKTGWSVVHLWSRDVQRHPEKSLSRILRLRSARPLSRKKG